jgi:leader peptidase (prepilin peptidase)/N-methyltransferase
MIARFATLPLEVRLLLVFLFSALVAGQLNRGIYRLAWNQRDIGPWSRTARGAPRRHWSDRIPIVGWFGLRRETSLHRRRYWLRPLLIELLFAIGMAGLYWLEISGRLVAMPLPLGRPDIVSVLHIQFVAHFLLISLMVVATFIDIDEKTIPDAITIPGTLLGLMIGAAVPQSRLLIIVPGPSVTNLLLTSPIPWWDGLDDNLGLWIGIACFLAWCYALLPKTWWTRSGPIKAVRYLAASIARDPLTKWIGGLALFGCLVIVYFWRGGGPGWQAGLSSLVGLAFGGGLVWAVRFVAGWALRKEAMGFGDVTLMAMIGSYVGWQPALLIFFLAPLAGMVIAVSQWILTRQPEIAYGPFLCAATLTLIVFWGSIWANWGLDIFGLGVFVPILVGVCLLLMAVLLFVWRVVSSFFIRD